MEAAVVTSLSAKKALRMVMPVAVAAGALDTVVDDERTDLVEESKLDAGDVAEVLLLRTETLVNALVAAFVVLEEV